MKNQLIDIKPDLADQQREMSLTKAGLVKQAQVGHFLMPSRQLLEGLSEQDLAVFRQGNP